MFSDIRVWLAEIWAVPSSSFSPDKELLDFFFLSASWRLQHVSHLFTLHLASPVGPCLDSALEVAAAILEALWGHIPAA